MFPSQVLAPPTWNLNDICNALWPGALKPAHYAYVTVTTLIELDDRQITHLRLRHLLYDFLGGVLGLLPLVFLNRKEAQNTPLNNHIANVLGGHR